MRIIKIFLFISIFFCQTSYGDVNLEFEDWKKKFRIIAISNNISKKTFDLAINNTRYLPNVIKYDRFQPEFYEDTKTYISKRSSEQKVKQVNMFGREFVDVVLDGDTFDDAYARATQFCEETNAAFIPPFDHPKIIAGQGTVGKELWEDSDFPIDYIIAPVGGGGLSAGIGSYIKAYSPHTQIIGVEPEGAPAMLKSIEAGRVVTLDEIDKFVDGASVKKVGHFTFEICSKILDQIITVPEGKVCGTILNLYNEQAIVVEPAGALSITALDNCKEQIKGKNVVCVLSGSNNDIMRTAEIKERSLMYEGLKHYFIVDFPQRAGALREFLGDVLGPDDDITYFEYSKKTNRDLGPALIGLELKNKEEIQPLIDRMNAKQLSFEYVNDHPQLFRFIA